MTQLADNKALSAAYEMRDMMETHKKSEDLINIGAYKRGTNKRIDIAVDRHDAIAAFLKQPAEQCSTLAETHARLLEAAALEKT
jgi:flagellum-specific ATP synthase